MHVGDTNAFLFPFVIVEHKETHEEDRGHGPWKVSKFVHSSIFCWFEMKNNLNCAVMSSFLFIFSKEKAIIISSSRYVIVIDLHCGIC